MAVNLYIGVMGAGKTHESVKELVLVHSRVAKEGDRPRGIVAAIKGLDVAKVSEVVGHDCSRIIDENGASGIAVVEYERVTEPHFFPTEAEVLAGDTAHCVVQPGDLVIIDEAWRCYQTGMKLSQEHMEFLRMHRHMAHPTTGVTCDIAILIQDLSTLDKKIRNVVESVYRFKKHRSAGLNSRYLVQHFDGNSTRLSNLVNTWQRKYDPAIFPLYKSHTSAGAVEKNIDRRAVFWKDPKFILMMVLGVFAVVGGPLFAMHYLSALAGGDEKPKAVASPAPGTLPGQASQPGTPPSDGSAPAPAPVPKSKRPPVRIVGSLTDNRGDRWLIVDAGDGVAMMPEGAFQGTGVGYHGDYQGQTASTWGGSVPATRQPDRSGKPGIF